MLIIKVERGLVTGVQTDDPKLKGHPVRVLDYDTEGLNDDEVIEVGDSEAYVYNGVTEVEATGLDCETIDRLRAAV